MIVAQPGLVSAKGVYSGPQHWKAPDLNEDDQRAIDTALNMNPIGFAAWPDGQGAKWLLDVHLLAPDVRLWWHLGNRLTPAPLETIRPMAQAFVLLNEAAEWLELKWGHLPGVAEPHEAPYPLSFLAAGLPGVCASALVEALRSAPVDINPEHRTEEDLKLSVPPVAGRLCRKEAELLAEAGGYPSPEIAGWVIQTAFRPRNAKPARSVRRLAGITSGWPAIGQAVGFPAEDPSGMPKIEPEAAALLEEAAAQTLAGAHPPKATDLARCVMEADAEGTQSQ